jgi:hypothetical protein
MSSITHGEFLTHDVVDAVSGTAAQLTIEPDAHGLILWFPSGEHLIVDYASGKFTVYRDNPTEELDPVPLAEMSDTEPEEPEEPEDEDGK